ncbi:MAG: DNA repair protein RecO [Candidatus Polarisedimenticolia bacterium]
MPQRESEAFVLTSRPLGEADRIVVFLTRASGKVRGVAKGARRSRRRFGANLMPLSRVRLRYFEREGSDLARVESADLLESFYLLQEDPERAAALSCLVEVTDAFAREEAADEAFFRLLHAVLRAVREGLHLDPALRYFEIWTLRLHGVLPDLLVCPRCGRAPGRGGAIYDRRGGTVVCVRCRPERAAGDVTLPEAFLPIVRAILTRPPEGLRDEAWTAAALRALGELAGAIFFDLTERRFKSYEVLRALRGGA